MTEHEAAPPQPDYLDLVADMTRSFAESQDIDETLRRGLERIVDALDAEAASLFVVSPDGGAVTCHACVGPVDITGLRLAPGEGIVGRAVNANACQMVRDAREDPDFRGMVDAATGFETKSILCAPLAVQDECLGAIEVLNRRGGDGLFTEADARLLDALATSAALALMNARLAQAMVERERVRRELELAADIQRRLLPATGEGPAAVQGINLPAGQVSGDFYDVVVLDDGRVAFNVGDVAGKGMNAALVMAKTASLFRCLVRDTPEPGPLLGRLNGELTETATHGMFVTMVAGIYDPVWRRVTLANAGHEPPLVHDRAADAFQPQEALAPPLGIIADATGAGGWPERTVPLNGAALYVFTDGLTEAQLEDGRMLSADGVAELVRGHNALPPAERVEAVAGRVHGGEGALADDVTLLVVDDGEGGGRS